MPAPLVLPPEAQKKMTDEGYTHVDVRTEEEFAAGHAAGSFNVPVSIPGAGGALGPNADFLGVMEKAFGKDAKLIVACKGGGRSARAGQMLLDAGFTNVLDQTAGWEGKSENGWKHCNLPIETGLPSDRSYSATRAK